MTAPTTLAESWAEACADAPLDPRATPAVQGKRDFMAGALACLVLQSRGATRDQLMAEVVAFGRVVGTAAERAQ